MKRYQRFFINIYFSNVEAIVTYATAKCLALTNINDILFLLFIHIFFNI